MTLPDIYDYLRSLQDSNFYGTITLQMQGGEVVFIRNEQVIKEIAIIGGVRPE